MFALYILCLSLALNVVQNVFNRQLISGFWTQTIFQLEDTPSSVQFTPFVEFVVPQSPAAYTLVSDNPTRAVVPSVFVNHMPPACDHNQFQHLQPTKCFHVLDSLLNTHHTTAHRFSNASPIRAVQKSPQSSTAVITTSLSDAPVRHNTAYELDHSHITLAALFVVVTLMLVSGVVYLMPVSRFNSMCAIFRMICSHPHEDMVSAFVIPNTSLTDFEGYMPISGTMVMKQSETSPLLNVPLMNHLDGVPADDTLITGITSSPSESEDAPIGSSTTPVMLAVASCALDLNASANDGLQLPSSPTAEPVRILSPILNEFAALVSTHEQSEAPPSQPTRKPRHRSGRQVREKRLRKEAERAAQATQQATGTTTPSTTRPPRAATPTTVDSSAPLVQPSTIPPSRPKSPPPTIAAPLVHPPHKTHFVPLRRMRAGRKIQEKRARKAARRSGAAAALATLNAEAGPSRSSETSETLPPAFTDANWPALFDVDYVPKSLHSGLNMSYACVTAISPPTSKAVIVTDQEHKPLTTRASFAKRDPPKHKWLVASRRYEDLPSRLWPLDLEEIAYIRAPKKIREEKQ